MPTLSVRRAVQRFDLGVGYRLRRDVLALKDKTHGSLRNVVAALHAEGTPWEIVVGDSLEMAVHAALIHTGERGKVLYFGGDYHADYAYLHDLADDFIAKPRKLGETHQEDSPFHGLLGTDLFCAGHAFLFDGDLLVAGGQLPDPSGEESDEHQHGGMAGGGERTCYRFRSSIEAWADAAPMNLDPHGQPDSGGRWYPAVLALGNGKILAVGGHPDVREVFPAGNQRHSNNTPEIFHPLEDSWSFVGGDTTEENPIGAYDYHRLHLMPDGKVFFASNTREKNRLYDADTGRFLDDPVIDLPDDGMYRSPVAEILDEETGEVVDILRSTAIFTSVMLPLMHREGYVPRILVAGDRNAYICDFGEDPPRWRKTLERDFASTPPRRHWSTGIILANGEIFITGGCERTVATEEDGVSSPEIQQSTLVLEGEICRAISDWSIDLPGDKFFDFERVTWRTVERAHVGRRYHGTALLLPDGTVWTGGSNGTVDFPRDSGVTREAENRIEIYRPDYCRAVDRPELHEAPSRVSWGEEFEVVYSSDFGILNVVLIRNGSSTHGYNGDQRFITLDHEEAGEGRLRAIAPPNASVAPPGYYMLWIRDRRGSPCRLAKFVLVTVP